MPPPPQPAGKEEVSRDRGLAELIEEKEIQRPWRG